MSVGRWSPRTKSAVHQHLLSSNKKSLSTNFFLLQLPKHLEHRMGCACRTVRMAQAAGVIGILFSSLAMAPPVVSYFVDPEWSFVQPALDFLQESLEKEYRKDVIKKSTLESLKSFINGFGENLNFTAIFVIIMSSMNIFMDLFMLIGSCCNVRYILLHVGENTAHTFVLFFFCTAV